MRFLLYLLPLGFLLPSLWSASFPAKILDYETTGTTVYDSMPLGFSVADLNPESGAKFDIYFYDNGNEKLPDGVSDPVQKEFGQVFAAIYQMQRLGYYRDIGKPMMSKGSIDLGGETISCLSGMIQFQQTEKGNRTDYLGTRTSFAFLTAYQGRFIKVRFTMNTADQDLASERFTAIMNRLESCFPSKKNQPSSPPKETPSRPEKPISPRSDQAA
ncbi:hypothetical protein [Puniceicoccus vermicola]|uniref:DUF1795 domain-containing protein n=1 Tax=Puniceicoccus vermicola TaxID=388746 RepID=A0A7X1AYU5_9BACT|nr:hypothetical protein [Puniceicoccus vermicola]MBC2602500.1 hypothetical protein [Puniceicoccus vermicola]